MAMDMSSAAIDGRLREASRMSNLVPPFPLRVDMSAAAIDLRLREVSQMHALERQLRAMRPRANGADPSPQTRTARS